MNKFFTHFLFLCLYWCSLSAFAALENGVYSISCLQGDGYVALGANHNVDPYICYIKDGSDKTADAYWVVTNTKSGYTFRNEASGQYLVFTTGRVDANYKYMTLADSAPDDQSHLWYVSENEDGSFSINSVVSDSYYWNLRYDQGLLGTYHGGWGNSNNEHFFFEKKGDGSDPDPQIDPNPEERTSFPDALHIYLKDGRLEAYPKDYVTKCSETDGQLVIETNIGQTFTYALAEVESVSEKAPTDLPTFESFKFNNKYNDQVFTDVDGEMIGDTVFVTIGAIGKRLTPSYKLPEGKEVEVYVNNELQESKVSRLRFDKDIYYVATRPGYRILLPDNSSKKGASTYSMQPYGRIVRVHVDWLTDRAEVPTIYINTSDGKSISSKDYFKDATIRIDGHDIFPSMDETEVQIKGRGNSSWGWPKKPYRLKFADAVKPLGMKKGKNWVLLSNYQTGSMMSNAIGMKAANLMGAAAANHIVPVDIYLNGEYRGSYNFTEKVGLANNSVDLDDESAAALLELDSYYDEESGQKFRSEPYGLPINVKEPTFSEGTTKLTLEDISSNFNAFMRTVYWKRDISKYVDVTQLARFMMVNELILNYEFYHPKSTFCYRESFESDTSKYVFGPVWDLDWAYGYERYGNYFRKEATNNYWIDCPNMEVVEFIRDLRFKYEPLSDIYKTLWEQFMENDLTELLEYCQDYYDFAKNSFKDNRKVWGDNTDYAAQAKEAASWLDTRTQVIYEDIVSGRMPDIIDPGEDPGDDPEEIQFANNKLYTLTCRRGGLVLNDDHTGLAAGQTRTDAPDEDKLFAILNIEGKNYMYSPVTKEFLNYRNNGNWVDALGTPIHFSTSNADGKYLYMLSVKNDNGGTYYFNNNGQIVINSWDTPDAGNRWLIEEAEDFDPTEALALAEESFFAVTNRILFNGQVVGEEIYKLPDGSKPPKLSSQWITDYTSITEPEDIPFTIHENTIIDYEVEWTGPFEFSTSEEDAVWYNMNIRSVWYVGKQDSEPYYPTKDNGEVTNTAEYLWAFGGDPYHVKVYNFATGFAETLTKDGGNAVMREGDYTWDLLPNNGGFVLRETGTDYCCINQFGGGGGPLKFWDDGNSPTDDGSTFRVEEAIDVVDGIAKLNGVTSNDNQAISSWYDLGGRRTSTPKRKGVYIIRMKNGISKKVIIE